MKKKIKSSMLFFVSIFMFLTLLTIPTKAADTNTLYIRSDVSSEYDEYARRNIGAYLDPVSIAEGINITSANLGQGFKIYNAEINGSALYYYPISIGNEITFIFKVYKDVDNTLTGSITRNEAQEINSLKNISTNEKPAMIISSNGNTLARIENEDILISTTPVSGEVDEEIVNLLQSKESSTPIKNVLTSQFFAKSRISFRYTYITIDYLEKQGSYPWCAAYATANILRYIKKTPNIYAKTIMDYFGLGTSSSLSHAQIKAYALYQGVSTSNYISGKPNQLTVESKLFNGRPIYASMQVGSQGHALVVHGCNANLLTVRNPWYQYSETYNHDTNTYVTGGSTIMTMRGYITFN